MAPQSRGPSPPFHTHPRLGSSLAQQQSILAAEEPYRNRYLTGQVASDLSLEDDSIDVSDEEEDSEEDDDDNEDDEEDEEQDEDGHSVRGEQVSPPPAHLGVHHHDGMIKAPTAILQHHPYFLGSSFAPPFYNRPPTPLPPSPSLTSLLRPPFSAATSRPTTPSDSDAESSNIPASNAPEAAVARSAKKATRVPRASPKVPTYEYYGFVMYIGSSLVFLMYIIWSMLPAPVLHGLGIDYYPNRWWSLALPAWLVMTVIYIYAALGGYNTGYLTLSMESIENVVDEKGSVAVMEKMLNMENDFQISSPPSWKQTDKIEQHQHYDDQSYQESNVRETDWRAIWSVSTDAVLDIPIGAVCEVLYGEGRGPEPELSRRR